MVIILDTGVAEATCPARTGRKVIDDIKSRPDHRYEYQLGNTIARLDGKSVPAAVPAGDEYLALIIRIDKPHQVAEHNTMLMTETGAWQDDRGQLGILDVQGNAGRYKFAGAGRQREFLIEAGTQIETGRAIGGIPWQGDIIPQTRIDYFYLYVAHDNGQQ